MADDRKMGRRRHLWLAIGILCFPLGIAAILSGAPLAFLEVGGWPWNTTIYGEPGTDHVVLQFDDGRVEEFTGSPADATAWVSKRHEELKLAYGFDHKIALGRALCITGFSLLAVGVVVLLWRLVTFVVRRWPTRAGPGLA
ncbi:hypothetical protein [Kutzneria buriramensis]|uniref:Uncharacterized protein n=1 Tax=Kutzneria buriramensis TaxID=1045776 RepID=A0A3E0G5X5_9PSEU|nr:hypothetical protein [Kutzneria buriramensis]REH18123.1 hypothetical protein BCF44_13710 [Kutzneria buriramensis]